MLIIVRKIGEWSVSFAVSRVPCIGEIVRTRDLKNFTVTRVFHLVNSEEGEAVAIVEVRDKQPPE